MHLFYGILLCICSSIFIGVIIYANIVIYNERKNMTPEERRAYDEENAKEMRIW